jgi:hypothetical protein
MWTWFKQFWKNDSDFKMLIAFIWIIGLIAELVSKQHVPPWPLIVSMGASIFYIGLAYLFRKIP